MQAKVSQLMRAFRLSEPHAFQLLQAAGANYDIAYNAWIASGDEGKYGTYGIPETATERMGRLVMAKAIAQTKAIEARDAAFHTRR